MYCWMHSPKACTWDLQVIENSNAAVSLVSSLTYSFNWTILFIFTSQSLINDFNWCCITVMWGCLSHNASCFIGQNPSGSQFQPGDRWWLSFPREDELNWRETKSKWVKRVRDSRPPSRGAVDAVSQAAGEDVYGTVGISRSAKLSALN